LLLSLYSHSRWTPSQEMLQFVRYRVYNLLLQYMTTNTQTHGPLDSLKIECLPWLITSIRHKNYEHFLSGSNLFKLTTERVLKCKTPPTSLVGISHVSNRSAGLMSSRFPGVSRRHFDKNSVEFEVFETVSFDLNEEACGDRPHPTPITVSIPQYQFILVYCQMFLLIHFEGGAEYAGMENEGPENVGPMMSNLRDQNAIQCTGK